MDCPDLKQLYGKRFKVVRDEDYYAEYGKDAHRHDPWYLQIPCRCGGPGSHIFPFGKDTLAVSVDRAARLRRKLLDIGCQDYLDCEDGFTVTFPVKLMSKVAKIVRPKRKKQISEKERQRLTVQLAKARQIATEART